MQQFADRLGEGFLRIIEQVIPAASRLEDHSVLIGEALLVALALVIVWSAAGIARRR